MGPRGRRPLLGRWAGGEALSNLAHDERIDATHRAVLVRDGAGWHTAGTLVVSDGIDVVLLPPASSELQPVERLWPLVDEVVANKTSAYLADRKHVLVARGHVLRADRRRVKGHTHFHQSQRERHPRGERGRRNAR